MNGCSAIFVSTEMSVGAGHLGSTELTLCYALSTRHFVHHGAAAAAADDEEQKERTHARTHARGDSKQQQRDPIDSPHAQRRETCGLPLLVQAPPGPEAKLN